MRARVGLDVDFFKSETIESEAAGFLGNSDILKGSNLVTLLREPSIAAITNENSVMKVANLLPLRSHYADEAEERHLL